MILLWRKPIRVNGNWTTTSLCSRSVAAKTSLTCLHTFCGPRCSSPWVEADSCLTAVDENTPDWVVDSPDDNFLRAGTGTISRHHTPGHQILPPGEIIHGPPGPGSSSEMRPWRRTCEGWLAMLDSRDKEKGSDEQVEAEVRSTRHLQRRSAMSVHRGSSSGSSSINDGTSLVERTREAEGDGGRANKREDTPTARTIRRRQVEFISGDAR